MNEREIFDRAQAIPDPTERAAYLEEATGGDARLKEHIEGLIEAHQGLGRFLHGPALEVEATVDRLRFVEHPGQMVGPYKLREEVGTGGFGVVWAAEQLEPIRRKVALKIIKPGMDSEAVVARFEAERQALAMMEHPNIARVFDAGTTEQGRPYFVMELIRGVPITEYCDENRLTVQQRLTLFIDVCKAVQHAHQKGIIHRDVKPSNVLVTLHDGMPVPKVIDFGIAKALNQRLTERTIYTGVHQAIGTLAYMSPEAAELSGLDMDTRADVYGLGVLLYELLTGTTPFDKDRLERAALHEACRIIREEEPPKASTKLSTLGESATVLSSRRNTDPRSLAQLVHGDLDWILVKSLEKDRTRRYESASALAADVGRFLRNDPIEARPPSTLYRLKKSVSRHRAALAATSLVILSLIAGIASTSWMALARQRERDEAIRQTGIAQLAVATANQAQAQERTRSEELLASQTDLRQTVALLHDELRDICMAAVMSGDEERALAAINRAEAAELPETWLNVLRGQLALYLGKPDDAIQLLSREAQQSVVAESMLALAYLYSGRLEESAFTARKVKERRPETVEDLLFSGQAISVYEPEEGVRRIRLAKDKRDTPLARMILAHASAHVALDTGDRDLIASALKDAEAARCFLGDTPGM